MLGNSIDRNDDVVVIEGGVDRAGFVDEKLEEGDKEEVEE